MTLNLYQQTSYALSPDYLREEADRLRQENPALAAWVRSAGIIPHTDATQIQAQLMAESLLQKGLIHDVRDFFSGLQALDCLTQQAMWLVIHMTYTRRVWLDGRDIDCADFKENPRGHTGGALNMVPAYAGLLALNHFTQQPRDWLIGQGHCVAAIDALQLLTGTATPARRQQYPLTEEGLSRFVTDSYDTHLQAGGFPRSTLGAHVNTHTAGARLEGGYLGIAGMQYAHMPLPGERLVAFLSDGAFEEQRGTDWAARWWRGEDTGLVAPVMIANGRRIDQRTTIAQQGGCSWFVSHLRNQGFSPFVIDGRDPAAFVCAVYYMEIQLQQACERIRQGDASYPVAMPYCIAETVKGFGFPGAGTDAAYGLPLGAHPAQDSEALAFFRQGCRQLFQPETHWRAAAASLKQPKRKLAPMLAVNCPEPEWSERRESAMSAIDRYFIEITEVNPRLRVRIGNPDELRSNGMNQTLDQFRHRVTKPEISAAEAIDGCVITALNEEAVLSACLANQAGINLVVAYEAFAVKMLCALRQTIIFSRQQKEAGDPAEWLGFPVITTSLIWENGANDQSHQDSSLAESLMLKMADMVRVVFPPDANSAMACLRSCYGDLGVVWNMVVARSCMPAFFNAHQAQQLVQDGAVCVRGHCGAEIQLVACGAVQLKQMLKASDRLRQQRVAHSLMYVLEPGRFRSARDVWEGDIVADTAVLQALFPARVQYRVFLVHTRSEAFLAVCRQLDLGPQKTRALGYINRGGTLGCEELLFVNRCTWAHVLAELEDLCGQKGGTWLTAEEWVAVQGNGDPYDVIGLHH
ncbi:xylulose 5-phosphate 3-epimerase [Thalassolituus sp. LLYu03]|uniref:xylulose 5-phosphate 3-epimerase n=1 Tax=Thalassolituus sp. LLYu03 TaxID=3421656 RepID=UPI003D267C5D